MKACRRHSPPRLVLLFLLVLGAVTARAPAQGLPMLPDPMTTRDLVVYSELLQLSDQQRAALEPIHDAYLDRFARLRRRDIQDFQDQLIGIALQFQFEMVNIPERAELEAVLESWENVLSRIESVDRTLFADIEGILIDEQWPRMDRVRNTRRLQLYERIDLEMTGDLNAGAAVNLTELVTWLDLDDADRATVDELLVNYESARLTRTQRLHKVILDVAVVVLDTVDNMGIRDMTPQEMMALGNDEETITSLRTTFDEASRPFQESAHALSQLNLQTYRRLHERLSESAAETLRDRYYRRAYDRVYGGPMPWRARYDHALDSDDAPADAEVREQIRFERDRFARQDDSIVERLVEMVEKDRKYRPSGTLWEMEPDPLEERINEQQQRRRNLDERANWTLDGLLSNPPEAEEATASDDSPEGRVTVMAGPGGVRTVVHHDPTDAGSDAAEPFLPSPIKRAELDRWADHLAWDDGQRTIAEALFDDYRQRFDAIRTGGADETLPEKEGGDNALSPRVHALRDTDEAFFDELSITAAQDKTTAVLDRRRLARRRQVYGEMTRGMMWTGRGAANVDLVDIIFESDLPPSVDDFVDAVLSGYEQELAELFVERYDLARSAWRRGELANAAMERGAGAIAQSSREKQRELEREVRRRTERIGSVTQAHVSRLLDDLPSDEVWDVRHRFNRAAYPGEYEDADDVEKLMSTALELADVTASQREGIEELSMTFRSRYFDLSDRMIELRQQRNWSEDREHGPQRDEIEREIEMETLRFRRDEITDRATVRLELILTGDQSQRVPGLVARNLGPR